MSSDTSSYILYLDTRDLPLERDGEILAAIESGYGLIIATDHPEKFRYHQVDHLVDTPVGRYDRARQEIHAYIKKHHLRIAGVVCWKDREVELASQLALDFKLPGNSHDVARRVRDKAETRRTLDLVAGVNPRYAVVTSKAEFESGTASVGYPCLIKPAGNSGSRGIFRITDTRSHHLYEEFLKYNRQGAGDMFSYFADHALLEEELSGTEHSVAGLVYQGRVFVTALADKKFERDILMQYENVIPSRLGTAAQTAIVDVVRKGIRAIGMEDGGFHADVILDAQNPRILEIGGRLGGEMINSHLIPLAYGGLSPYKELIRILTGSSPSISEDAYKHPRMQAGARVIRAPRIGRIKQIHGLDVLTRHPAVRLVMPMKGPEGVIQKPRDKFKEYEVAYAIVQCGLQEDVEQLLTSIERLVVVEMHEEPALAKHSSN